MQLKCKNKTLHNLITSKPKNVTVIKYLWKNLSTENLDIEPLRYGLHHSYVDKNKNGKSNVATELESLSIILEKYINLS